MLNTQALCIGWLKSEIMSDSIVGNGYKKMNGELQCFAIYIGMCTSKPESPSSLLSFIYEIAPAHESDTQIEGLYVLYFWQMAPELSCNPSSTIQKRARETNIVLL